MDFNFYGVSSIVNQENDRVLVTTDHCGHILCSHLLTRKQNLLSLQANREQFKNSIFSHLEAPITDASDNPFISS